MGFLAINIFRRLKELPHHKFWTSQALVISCWLQNFAWMWYYVRSFKNTKIVTKFTWLFWWRHVSWWSLKLRVFMNKSHFSDIITKVYNNHVFWKGVTRKVNDFFLNPLDLKLWLILPRIYLIFQKKTYTKNNTLSWKSADTAKISSNFERNP